MSRERELLRRLLENFEHPVTGRFGDLFDEVRANLAAEEGKEEDKPFSIIQSSCIRGLQLSGKPYPRTCPACGLGPCKISHTPAPSAEKREPLSNEEIWEIEQSIPPKTDLKAAKLLFARKIEAAHGIGDKHDQ